MKTKPNKKPTQPTIPPELLEPLVRTDFFGGYAGLETSRLDQVSNMDALLPALDGDALDLFGFMIVSNFRQWLDWPDRTSLRGHWMAGDVLFSAAWTHVAGWLMDVTVYRTHPEMDGAALRVRIVRGALPANPVGLLEMTDPCMARNHH